MQTFFILFLSVAAANKHKKIAESFQPDLAAD
jgi:hypothetical protein